MLGLAPHYQEGRVHCAGSGARAEIRGGPGQDGQLQSSAGTAGMGSSWSSSGAASGPGTSEEPSQERKTRALLLLYLEPHRPVHEVEIQVIQFQVGKSLLASSLHQRLLVKCGPQLEK